jgi:hypothetical protein
MLAEKEKYFTGLTDQDKTAVKKMFNEYLNDYSKMMDYKDAIECAMYSTRQNASIMFDTYKGARS